MKKDPLIYIEHIRTCISRIKEYTEEIDEDSFLKNNLIQDAVIRNFEIITFGAASAVVKLPKSSTKIFEQSIQKLNGRRLLV